MVVALPVHHDLAGDRRDTSVSLASLSVETFILYGPPGTGMYDATIAACHAAGFSPRVGNLGSSTQQAPRITSTLSLVAAGLGISLIPASLQRMRIDGVAYRAISGEVLPKVLLSLATRRGDASAVVRRFVEIGRRRQVDHA